MPASTFDDIDDDALGDIEALLGADWKREHEKRVAELYALVRGKRPHWRKLHKSDRQWWLNYGSHDGINRDPPFRDHNDNLLLSEYDQAVAVEQERALVEHGHKPNRVTARITRSDNSVIVATVITNLCEPDCAGCEMETQRIADEWEASSPVVSPFVHDTTLGLQQFDLPDYGQVPPAQAIDHALRDVEVLVPFVEIRPSRRRKTAAKISRKTIRKRK